MIEILANDSLSVGLFLGLGADEKVPDHSTLTLFKNRLSEKKDKNKEVWLKLKESAEYKEGLKERSKIERKFGEVRKWHGFVRSRYIGFRAEALPGQEGQKPEPIR